MMTEPHDVPFAAPPKHTPQVMGLDAWNAQMRKHQAWLDAERRVSAGDASGGSTAAPLPPDSDLDNDLNDDNVKASDDVRPAKDKPGVFNVYAHLKYEQRTPGQKPVRIGDHIAADGPAEAIDLALDGLDGGLDDVVPSSIEARRQRGKSYAKGDDKRRRWNVKAEDDFDVVEGTPGDGSGEGQPASPDAADGTNEGEGDGEGEAEAPPRAPAPDDVLLHRLGAAPLIGEDAEQRIIEIVSEPVVSAVSTVVEKQVQDLLDTHAPSAVDLDEVKRAIAAAVHQIDQDREARAPVIKVQYPDKEPVVLDGHFHPMFGDALHLLARRKPVYLYGPSGAGKTFMAEQLAAALFPDMDHDDRFFGLSATMGMSESHLQGWRLPLNAGEFVYVPSEFLKRFENGGLFLLDEVDRADPNVLAVLNQALANARMPVPARFERPYARMHKDFCMLCGGNTAGTGADRLYTAATRLDEAFLDRFRVGTLFFDYDRVLEETLVGKTLLLQCLWIMRQKCSDLRIERVISTRSIVELHDLFDGDNPKESLEAMQRLQTTWDEAETDKINIAQTLASVSHPDADPMTSVGPHS